MKKAGVTTPRPNNQPLKRITGPIVTIILFIRIGQIRQPLQIIEETFAVKSFSVIHQPEQFNINSRGYQTAGLNFSK